MARTKKRKPVTPQKQLEYQNRCRRQARLLTWHGTGFPGDTDDYVGGIDWPKSILSRDRVVDLSHWAIHTPNRWWCRVVVYCQDSNGKKYTEETEKHAGQALLAQEVSEWRLEILAETKNRCNPKHIVLEKFETGIL